MSIGGAGGDRGLAIYHTDYGRIRFYQSTTNISTIHSFGTSWAGGDVFASGGAINITGNTGVTFGGWNIPDVVFVNGGTSYFRNNVGIGTTNPTSKLQVNGNIDATGVISQTFWTNDSIRKLNANASLNFRTAAGPIEMVLDGSGNLVVGGISPNASNGAKIFGLKSESVKYFTQNAFGQDGGYTWPSTTYVTGNDNSPVGNTTFRGNGAFQGHVTADYVPIDATKTYKVSVWMRAVSGSPFCYLSHRQYFWDYSPGNPSNGGWGNPYWFSGTPSSSWTEYSMTIGPAGSGADYTHMAGVKFIRHGWLHNYTGDGSATAEFQGWKVEELDSILANNVTVMGSAVATQSWVQSQNYLTSETDSQTLSWEAGGKNLTISNGNTVTLDGLATEEYVTSQGYITGYTESDTLATVTGRGSSTSAQISLNGGYIVPDGITNYGSHFQTTDYTTMTFFSRAWQSVQGTNGLAYAFNTHTNDGNAGYQALQIYYGESGYVYAPTSFRAPSFHGDSIKIGVAGSTPTVEYGIFHQSGVGLGIASGAGGSTQGIDFWSHNGTSFFQSVRIAGSTGNVGVGTITPDNKLTVKGDNAIVDVQSTADGQTVGFLARYLNNSTLGGAFRYTTGDAQLYIDNLFNGNNGVYSDINIRNCDTAGAIQNRIKIKGSNGYVGINNTSPSTQLHVGGVITSTGGNSTNWNTAYSWGNHADASYFKVDSAEPVTIQAETVNFSGNVVIEGTLTESSSIRFKENIKPLEPALNKVEQLNPVTYNKIGVVEEEIGLIAEEVAELFPEVVTYNEAGQPQGVQYQRLSVILLKAMQEQNAVIAALTERVNKLENK
jgi:hypothetical protein